MPRSSSKRGARSTRKRNSGGPGSRRGRGAAVLSRSSRSTHGGAGSMRSDAGSGRTSRSSGPDITALLKADHRKVARLFEQFENAKQASRKRQIFERIQSELAVHARLEEQVFYRESEEQGRKKLLEHVEEAHGEHKVVKQLLRQADGLDAD